MNVRDLRRCIASVDVAAARPTVLALLLLATACNAPPPGNGGGPGGGTNPPPADVAERVQDVEHAAAMVEAALADDGAIDTAKVLADLSASGDFAAVEVEDGCVFARYPDGETLVVIANRNPPPPGPIDTAVRTARSKVAARPANADPSADPKSGRRARLSAGLHVRLMNAMGTAFPNAIPDFETILGNIGYDVRDEDPSVENLKRVRSDAVFYFSTHGARRSADSLPDEEITIEDDGSADAPPTVSLPPVDPADRRDHFCLWTTTEVTNETLLKYRDELRVGNLIYAVATNNLSPTGSGKPSLARHLCITDKFVRTYGWSFDPTSMVIIDACSSFDTLMQSVCFQAGAYAYLGWTRPTGGADAYRTIRYLFDRMLGSGSFPPDVQPSNRPFALDRVLEGMQDVVHPNGVPLNQSASVDGDGNVLPATVSEFMAAGGTHFLLRPSIQSMTINEEAGGQLTINGDFGERQGRVKIDGRELSVASGDWTSGKITCMLAPMDAGSVQVDVDGHMQERSITAWDLVLHFRQSGNPSCPPCFSLSTFAARLRMDAAPVRLQLDADPIGGNAPFTSIVRDASHWMLDAVGGVHVDPNFGFTVAWTAGNPTVPEWQVVCPGGVSTLDYFGVCAQFNRDGRRLTLAPNVLTPALVATNNGQQSIRDVSLTARLNTLPGTNLAVIPLDEDFTVPDGSTNALPDGSTLSWDDAEAISKPGQDFPL